MCFSPGLIHIAYTITLNEDRKLIFVGDSDRVKSYSWDVEFGRYRTSLPAVHTLNTCEAPGPLEILPNGRRPCGTGRRLCGPLTICRSTVPGAGASAGGATARKRACAWTIWATR